MKDIRAGSPDSIVFVISPSLLTNVGGVLSGPRGAAIDFAGSKVSGTCARPASAATVASWTMINRNAARFGIHQYEPESWHWEAAPSPCA